MREIQTKIDSLQQHSETNLEFIRRTDALADQSGLNLSQLPEILGFSKPSLFAYRSGKNRITPKVWLKLERAERSAGLISLKPAPPGDIADSSANLKESHIGETAYVGGVQSPNEPEESGSMLRDESGLERLRRLSHEIKGPLDAPDLKPFLERIATALEKLVEIEQERDRKL